MGSILVVVSCFVGDALMLLFPFFFRGGVGVCCLLCRSLPLGVEVFASLYEIWKRSQMKRSQTLHTPLSPRSRLPSFST